MPTLCSRLLAENGCTVRLYTIFPENADAIRRTGRNDRYLPGAEVPAGLGITTDPAEVLEGADLILSAVPSQFIRRWWQPLKPHYRPGTPVCSATKGIENGTLLRPTQVIADVLARSPRADLPLAALSGPCIAREVARGLPATVVAASGDPALAEHVQRLFTTPNFRVYTNPDLAGVELAGATKNVIAIAAGILDGLGAGDNAKAALITRGLAEITRLGLALGARRETFAGLAGLGDLVTTCVSPHGRNRTLGQAIGSGKALSDALAAIPGEVEGVATARSVLDLARRHDIRMPISQAVHAVLFEGLAPRDAVARLMARPLRAELA
jgi:glycerol-3-phosphate dehydrogenase (NAD(P)+)